MKVGFFSDTHFGFGEGTERANECFENALQAFKLCFEQKVDVIVLAGDIFDEPLPSPWVLSHSFDVFLQALRQPKSSVEMVSVSKQGEKSFDFSGIPVIAIHGNHDSAGLLKTNILEVFSKSGFLVYLDPGKAVIKKNDEKVCIYGFSAVPEKKALDVLKLWSPVPEPTCSNLLVLHQSFKEFLPFADDMMATLSLDDLPKGFDLIVNGHLHWTDVQKLENSFFVLAGSTVVTQMKKLESEREKGVFVFDSEKKSLNFFSLPVQRRLFYFKLVFENEKPKLIVEKARQVLFEAIKKNDSLRVPLIRLKLEGSLGLGVNSYDVDLKDVIEEIKGKAILSVSKNFFSSSFKKKIADLASIQKSKLSLVSLGFELLEKNLAQTDFESFFDARMVFELLAENEMEKAQELIVLKKAT